MSIKNPELYPDVLLFGTFLITLMAARKLQGFIVEKNVY